MPDNHFSGNRFSGLTGLALFVFLPLVLVTFFFVMSYNGLVDKEEAVIAAWSQVESNYQRRADLVPNLVKTVQAYADTEAFIQTEVAAARADVAERLGALKTASDKSAAAQDGKEIITDEKKMEEFSQSEQEVGQAVLRVLALAESYPTLRSNENFLELQSQLEGTENRINVARVNFNTAAETFNAAIRRLPGSLLAGAGDFRRKAYFKADKGADKAPEVKFNE